jgi:hypothetical protein
MASVSTSTLADATWKTLKGIKYYGGTWISDMYPSYVAHGQVYAIVDYDKKSAVICLLYKGLYRKGSTVRLETRLTEGTTASDLSSITFKVDASDDPAINITFKADTLTATEVKGTYVNASPKDRGTFKLQVTTKEEFERFRTTAASSCSIA